jgi:hypothetical protein
MSGELWEISYGQIGALLQIMERNFIPREYIESILNGPITERALMDAMWDRFFGQPMYGPLEVEKALGYAFSPGESEALLKEAPSPRPGFLTFVDVGWKLVTIQRYCSRNKFMKITSNAALSNDDFASSDKQDPCWRQLRVRPEWNACYHTSGQQEDEMHERGERPTVARVIAMGKLVHLLAGKKSFNIDVRTVDRKGTDSGYVYVSSFRPEHMCIAVGGGPKQHRLLASERKL